MCPLLCSMAAEVLVSTAPMRLHLPTLRGGWPDREASVVWPAAIRRPSPMCHTDRGECSNSKVSAGGPPCGRFLRTVWQDGSTKTTTKTMTTRPTCHRCGRSPPACRLTRAASTVRSPLSASLATPQTRSPSHPRSPHSHNPPPPFLTPSHRHRHRHSSRPRQSPGCPPLSLPQYQATRRLRECGRRTRRYCLRSTRAAALTSTTAATKAASMRCAWGRTGEI
mmetsp:Transcript_30649/g.76096  ORF Transcript_30649/g.76096 Transcript_30649/m.76096 type:complete len:223 (+) Transcript_30649:1434-2102(+)